MARGYPDYFGTQIFPQFGFIKKQVQQVVTITDGSTEDVFNLSLKGITYGGYIRIIPTIWLPHKIKLEVTVDGTLMFGGNLQGFSTFKLSVPKISPLFLVNFDVVGKEGCVGVSPDLTFGYGYKIECENETGGNLVVTAELYYYHVTL